MFPRGPAVVVHRADIRDRRAAHFAGQLRSDNRGSDPARINQRVRCVELLEAFQEKRPLFGEKQREALVDGHLADVGLDLREIGIHRTRGAQILRDAPADVDPQLGIDVVIAVGRGRYRCAIEARGELRRDVHDQAAAQAGERLQRARLDEKARAGADHGRPGVFIAGMLRRADDLDTPVLGRAALIAEALEGNPHFDFVAPRGDASL